MNHYHRQMLLSASPTVVYQTLATQEGLRSWWTETCKAASAVGGQASFHFNNTYKRMQIESLVPDREVHWHCLEAHIDAQALQKKDEWVGTDIRFKLSPQEGGKTRLEFEHIGLKPTLECFGICNDGWNFFLDSLQSRVETGIGKPFAGGPCTSHSV
jgi:uncharacterized protein YndB with AHSA1/START domain